MRNLMSTLCGPCRAVIDENPFCVLFRRDDFGNYILCQSCRRSMWRANTNAAQGLHEFEYVNPSAPSTCSVDESSNPKPVRTPPKDDTPDSWICSRCYSRVHARPRKFFCSASGKSEPEDWWWCRKCQQETAQGRPHKDVMVHTRVDPPDIQPPKKQKTVDKAPPAQSQFLDHWLGKPRSSQ